MHSFLPHFAVYIVYWAYSYHYWVTDLVDLLHRFIPEFAFVFFLQHTQTVPSLSLTKFFRLFSLKLSIITASPSFTLFHFFLPLSNQTSSNLSVIMRKSEYFSLSEPINWLLIC